MASLQRLVHDGYLSLLKATGKTLPVCSVYERHTGKIETIMPSGACLIDESLEADFHHFQARTQEYVWPELPAYEFENASLVGDRGHIFLQDGRFFSPSLYPNQANLDSYKIRRPIRALGRKIKGTVFHLTGANHENKGHFMLDHLARLLAAESFLRNQSDYRILVAPGHGAWQKEYLKLLGVDTERVLEGSHGTITIERLLFVPFLSIRSSISPPHILQTLRDRLARTVLDQDAGPPLFLSRRDAPSRRLLNEDELFSIAREWIPGIQMVLLSGMSLQEQLNLYRRTPLFISPLGQASCNIVFCEGSTIINLKHGTCPASGPNNVGTHMASLTGNQGVTFFSGTEMGENWDWSFPPGNFREQIEKFMKLPAVLSSSKKWVKT